MQGWNPYAVGHKIYGGSSNAAHRGGGLDPMGYIERSLNRGLGGNASQQRSGFAQAAISKLGLGQGGVGKKKKAAPKKNGKPAPRTKAPGKSYGVGMVDEDNLSSVVTPVISNATGQLSLDPDLMQDTADAEFEYNNNRISLDQAMSDLLMQYQTGQRDLGQQQQTDQRGDLNRFAGRGMAFSSGYGNEVADSARMFGNAFSDLTGQFNSGQNYIGQQRLQNENFLTGARQRIAQRQAGLNTKNAGTLGLDPSYIPPVKNVVGKATPARKYSVPSQPKPIKKAAAQVHKKKKKVGK
jgi:hypothetical protein